MVKFAYSIVGSFVQLSGIGWNTTRRYAEFTLPDKAIARERSDFSNFSTIEQFSGRARLDYSQLEFSSNATDDGLSAMLRSCAYFNELTFLNTITSSALAIVAGRCATMMRVILSLEMASLIRDSFSMSRWLVASSRKRILGCR